MLYASYKTAHAASDDFSFHFFKSVQHCHKMFSKTSVKFFQIRDFSIKSKILAIMSRDLLAVETIYIFYIRIT